MTRNLSRGQTVVLGLVVLTGVALAGLALFVVGSRQWMRDPLHVRAVFQDVGGVTVGTPVSILGADAGEVEALEIVPDGEGSIILHLRIKGEFRPLIREHSEVQIEKDLFGSKVVHIKPGKAGNPVAENALLKSGATSGPSDYLATAAAKLVNGDGPLAQTKNDLEKILSRFHHATEKLNGLLDQADKVVQEVNAGKGTLGKLLKDEKLAADLMNTVKEVNGLVAEVKEGKGTLGKLFKDEKLYAELTKTLTQVNHMVLDVQDGKGSLGKMLNNTELYLEALKSLKDLQSTMTAFKQNADAIKSLPVISSYVIDFNKELNRPGSKRHRLVFAEDKLFEPGKSVLSASGKKALDAAADWFKNHKEDHSEVVIAAFSDPKKYGPDFAHTLTQKQSETVADYLKSNHKIHRMGFWWWSNRRVASLGCGTASSPVPETEKLPPSRIELIVFVPIK